MASQNTGSKPAEALTDCTNTPISRPRRSCGAYKSQTILKDSEDVGRNSENTPWSCPPLGRKYKTRRLSEPGNILRDVEGSCKSAGGSHKHSEVSLRHENYKQGFGTPQPVLPAVNIFEFPDSNEDADSQASSFHFKCRKEDISEKASFSCPPFRRPTYESPAEERSAKVRKRYSLGASEVLPKSGTSKKKMRRSNNSTSANDGKFSLPEDFVRKQKAYFAEIDAFVLQEEDTLDAD